MLNSFYSMNGGLLVKIIDFNSADEAINVFYGGNAGSKEAMIYNSGVWMIKYPKTTRDLKNPQQSYTTSPLSEYIGSRIFQSLGIPVHETILGTKKNKIVVACKDFTREINTKGSIELRRLLIPFHDLKNTFMSSDLDSYSGSGSETLITEVLDTIKGQRDLEQSLLMEERFWDMFVIDAFIGNNDRNNGNWGLLVDLVTNVTSLAPVYDNGNSFFNKRGLAQMETRLDNESLIQEDAYKTMVSAYKFEGLDQEGHNIKPYEYIRNSDEVMCHKALRRFVSQVNMAEIRDIIQEIPESYRGLAIMPEIQKEFYLRILEERMKISRHIYNELHL